MTHLKTKIDAELSDIQITEQMKQNISRASSRKPAHQLLRYAACFILILFLGSTTVLAVKYFNKIHVNDELLPELDKMKIVTTHTLEANQPEYGTTKETFIGYDTIQEKLGLSFLDTNLRTDHEYMIGTLDTDNKDYAMISIENYIIGDTSHYRKASGEPTYKFQYQGEPYTYDSGKEYYKSVSLDIFCILSESQLTNGFPIDYLGSYQFIEQYTSCQGYKVNLLESTTAKDIKNAPDNFQSEKTAIFVADGIHYELSGNVSWETMKKIVDSME